MSVESVPKVGSSITYPTSVTSVTDHVPKNKMTSKSWIFTLNNWDHTDYKRFKDLESSYLCIGEEVGDSGTPHLQGYICFRRSYRLAALKKIVPKAHWEPAITKDAQNYCMKEKYEIFDNRTQGARSDLKAVVATLKESGLSKCIESHPEAFVKYHGGISALALTLGGSRSFKPVVIWIYGPTGVGKTRSVVEREPDLWISGRNLRWWSGYNDQPAVLFDDFRRDFCTFHELLRILDRYPYTVEVKGGHRSLLARRMYITSCFRPQDVYETREDIGQLIRRIDFIVLKVEGQDLIL